MITTFFLILFSYSSITIANEIQWLNDEEYVEESIECDYQAPTYYYATTHVDFCTNFASDYVHQLAFEEKQYTYKSLSYTKKKWNIEAAFISLAWATTEAGWNLTFAAKNNNYWGLGGALYFMSFNSFSEGMGYKLLHLARGINSKGQDDVNHPGWPKLLPLFESRNSITSDQLNKALRSGPYVSEGFPYNNDLIEGTNQYINYGKYILTKALPQVLKVCLSVYEKEKITSKTSSKVNPQLTVEIRQANKNKVFSEMKKYVMKNFSKIYCR